MTEQPHLETPGGRIRLAREARGLLLEDLSELTKIPPPVLMAIEADEYHKVSGALYIKSFLRSCATELGLDADEILDLYGRFSGEVRGPAGVANPVWEEEQVQISHVGLPWRGIALTGLVLVLAGVAVLLMVRGCDDAGSSAATEASVPEMAPKETPAEAARQSGPAAAQDLATTAGDEGARKPARPDTLAGEWMRREPVVATGSRSASGSVSDDKAEASGQPAERPEVRDLPLPLVGGANLVFAGGTKQALVVRVISNQALALEIKSDAEQSYTPVNWPADGRHLRPLPPTGIVPGQVYAVGRGMVMYWGARDHVSLRVDRVEGLEVTLNGKVRDLHSLRPGAELLLDLSGN